LAAVRNYNSVDKSTENQKYKMCKLQF